MPEKATIKRARRDARQGKSATTQAGEFVREEIHHIRRGKHGARSTKQAIAIGLSKARRAGVRLGAPKKGTTSAETRRKAQRDVARGQRGTRKPARTRARAVTGALRREGRGAASRKALARQARSSARRRGHRQLVSAARKAVRTKGPAGRRAAARKAARTRRAHRAHRR
ncbi:MAG TPA: hypothetical protein VGQ69_14105 [Gemmatimonadales bacterium]|nr:hypothetical protein [Gemmatimonadales bacterium]